MEGDWNTSEGQSADEPVQVSCISQSPVEFLHTTLLETSVSVGQFAFDPVQNSATSQTPAVPRHLYAESRKALLGHTALFSC